MYTHTRLHTLAHTHAHESSSNALCAFSKLIHLYTHIRAVADTLYVRQSAYAKGAYAVHAVAFTRGGRGGKWAHTSYTYTHTNTAYILTVRTCTHISASGTRSRSTRAHTHTHITRHTHISRKYVHTSPPIQQERRNVRFYTKSDTHTHAHTIVYICFGIVYEQTQNSPINACTHTNTTNTH